MAKSNLLTLIVPILLSFLGPFAHAQEVSEIGRRFLGWFENNQTDSIEYFLSNKEYLFYDECQSILNRINDVYLHNNEKEAQRLHQLMDWLGHQHQKLRSSNFLVNMNKSYRALNTEQRQKKRNADSLSIESDKLRKNFAFEESKNLRNEIMSIYGQIGDSLLFVRQISELSLPTYAAEDYEAISGQIEEGIMVCRKIKDLKGELLILIMKGNLNQDHGRLSTARADYSAAMKIAEQLKDKENQAKALGNLGIVDFFLNNYEQSVRSFKRVLQISQDIDDGLLEEKATNNLAILSKEFGNYFEALKYYKKALKLARGLGNRMAEGNVLTNMGVIHRLLGNHELAFNCYNQALPIVRKTKAHLNETNLIYNLGVLYSLRGELDEALAKYREALELNRQNNQLDGLALTHAGIGNILSKTNNQDSQALKHFEKSLFFAKKSGMNNIIANSLLQLSRFMAGRQPQKAYRYAEELLRIAKQTQNPEFIWKAHFNMALLYQLQENDLSYGEHLMRAVGVVDSVRSEISGMNLGMNFYENQDLFELYFRVTSFWVNRENFSVAYPFLQGLKSRLLVEQIHMQQIQFPQDSLRQALLEIDGKVENLYRQYQQLKDKKELNQINDEIVSLEVKKKGLWSEIEERYPDYTELFSPKTISIPEIQDALMPNSVAIVDYLVGETGTLAFVITPDTLVALDLAIAKDTLYTLIDAVNPYSSPVKGPAPVNDQKILDSKSAHRLYRALFQPVEKIIGSRSDVIIIPDDRLSYLPFEILVTNIEESIFLLESHSFSYLPTVNLLVRDNLSPRRHNDKLYAFGNPHFGETSKGLETSLINLIRFVRKDSSIKTYLPLKGTEKEIQAILDIYGGRMFSGRAASESNFKEEANQAGILHLATHAYVDDRMPMYSKLVLSQAGDRDEDGFLQAFEIFNMKLNADLVVLSACETGIGKVSRGEGMASLARGFFHAGVPSLVASLWPADDIATPEIMRNFYNGLKQGMRKDHALRYAKMQYLKHAEDTRLSPYYWAGFVLMGDSAPIKRSFSIAPLVWFGLFLLAMLIAFISKRKVFKETS